MKIWKILKTLTFVVAMFFLIIGKVSAQPITPVSGCYLGAYLGCGINDFCCSTPKNFNDSTGKKHAFFTRYIESNSWANLTDAALWNWAESLKDTGINATPVLFVKPGCSFDSISNSLLDSNYSEFAQKCVDYNCPILFAFGYEMNGWWAPYCDTSGIKYIAAYQHVYNIIHSVAPNVQFCWVPLQVWGQKPYDRFYPGDIYVDWVGLNVYDRDYDCINLCTSGMFTSSIDADSFYTVYSANKNKPMLIGETALFDANLDPYISTPLTYQQQADEKNDWINQVYDTATLLSNYPNINLICYFHTRKVESFTSICIPTPVDITADWRIPLDTANDLYRSLISNSYFLTKELDSCIFASINENNINADDFLHVYPNPASEKITIETQEKSIIEILNIQGQLVKSIKSNDSKTNIDVSALQSGMYLVEVKTENGVVVRKFVKE
ncbi:MAG TPA: T9SS type A sorting domain-containing protein [Bacteroidales bacterium]|nr:T9SS type A sorting domain-containing protein [Bacteroidales bacterium]